MWIEELLEHDHPISIRFRDIRKTDASVASGSFRLSASTAGTAGLNFRFSKKMFHYIFFLKLK